MIRPAKAILDFTTKSMLSNGVRGTSQDSEEIHGV